ncbi:DNA-binding protein [Moritella sp. 36]|uniref:DNA-binding protein n=1 Tax=Moritella sp. 36 TaxID=2746233 RepID=UPI001BA62399|nr:DNA-binding protein [Moritella sp. 36]QUM87801.1 DNA-binding protein [Moritella sp. 36]
MSLQHIVDAANQLALEGKKPSMALIKSRLTQPANMRDIIETLKTWRFDPNAVVPPKNTPASTSIDVADPTAALIATAIASVREEITPLRQEVIELKAEIAALKKALLTQ